MTLRARLTLLTFWVMLISLLTFAGIAGVMLWRVELGSIARQTSAQADALLTITTTDPGDHQLSLAADDLLEQNGLSAAARIYDGAALSWAGGANGPDTLDPTFLSDQETRVTRAVGSYLVTSRRTGDITVQVGRSLEPLTHLLRRYALIAALTLLLLSSAGGALVAYEVRRTLHPLEQLAARVEHLDQPGALPAQEENDEVGALARALQRSLSALRAERERETLFLASASHELRTPVTAMLADVQHVLSRERPAAELRATLERTEKTASRLRQLTGNLMTLTRVQRLTGEHGPVKPTDNFVLLDLLEVAGEAVDLLQPLALKQNLDLWLDGQACLVRGDRVMLGSVLENLIGNAIKFTPRDGEVQVQVTHLSSGEVQLTVQDTGPGFPEGALTEAFVRGQTRVEGFGLGLAVVREVIEAHHGQLLLGHSSSGGAQVRVTLPSPGPAAVG